jgi:phosphoglycolate phosphatase-like HAD superfamily hydrolase
MLALNTYIQFVSRHQLPLKEPLFPENVFEFESRYPDLFRTFLGLMPLGNRAEDYFVIIRLLDRKGSGSIATQKQYDTYKETVSKKVLEDFHRVFYQNRNNVRSRNLQEWLDLVPSFPGIEESIPILAERFTMAIATSKDRESVDLQLNNYGLTTYFPPENILDKDFAHNKKEHIIRLQETYDIDFRNILFIDDKVSHLQSVKPLGVNCYLALWGFNSSREHKIAEILGFHLLQLEALKELGLP